MVVPMGDPYRGMCKGGLKVNGSSSVVPQNYGTYELKFATRYGQTHSYKWSHKRDPGFGRNIGPPVGYKWTLNVGRGIEK